MLDLIRKPYSSIVIDGVGILSVGDTVTIVTDLEETITGVVTAIKGKRDTKITLVPNGRNCEETWSTFSIDSLEILEKLTV